MYYCSLYGGSHELPGLAVEYHPGSKGKTTVSIASQSTQQKFPFPYDKVFDGLVAVIPDIGFSLKSQDRVIGRITASTGVSLFSWGGEPHYRGGENR